MANTNLSIETRVRDILTDATEDCIQDVINNVEFHYNSRLKRYIVNRGVVLEYLRQKHNLKTTRYAKGQKNYWILRGFSDEEAERLYHQYSKKYYSRSIEHYIEQGYTEEEALKKQRHSVEKARQTISQWSDEKRQAVNASKVNNLEACIRRYGEDEGQRRYNERIEKFKYALSLEGMTERYGEEEAKRLIEERNKSYSSNLEGCIRRYGEEEGRRRYEETCQKKAFAQTLEGYISRYGEEEGVRRFNERQRKYVASYNNKTPEEMARINKSKHVQFCRASKPSLKVFEPLHVWLLEKGIKDEDIFYGIGSRKEFCLAKPTGYCYWYDFAVASKKIIIEFNGISYHVRSPNQEGYVHPFHQELTAEVVWKRDQEKLALAKEKGYNVFVVWEDVSVDDNLNFLCSEISKLID